MPQRRFGLVMPEKLYNEFLLCYPDHGLRTNILRKVVKKLVAKAKEKGQLWEAESSDITTEVEKEMEDWPWES
jgi:hypothetical protein